MSGRSDGPRRSRFTLTLTYFGDQSHNEVHSISEANNVEMKEDHKKKE